MQDARNIADTLGSVVYRKVLNDAAIGMFEEANKLRAKNKQPENPTYHYHLGQAYEKAEKPALARQQFERVLTIDPNYTDAADIRKQLAPLRS